MRDIVLLTGCSSGIGAALAVEFHGRGLHVIATARRIESMAPLAAAGIETHPLDVDDGPSIAGAVAAVRERHGRLDMLVNNAGFGLFGAAADLDPAALRRQFETNVIAPVQVARAFLPLMLPRRNGRIVNLGSVSGLLTTPFAGAYCASKAALHALSDALRLELAPFGIRVVTVQPGAVASNIGETGTRNLVLPEGSIYGPVARQVRGRAMASQKGAMPASEFARRTVDAVLAPNPPAVFRAGPHSFRFPFLKRWLPTGFVDRKLARTFGLDRLAGDRQPARPPQS